MHIGRSPCARTFQAMLFSAVVLTIFRGMVVFVVCVLDKARFLEALNVEITDEEENGTAPEFTQTIGEFNVSTSTTNR